MLTQDQYSELFEAQVTGSVATAFIYSRVEPTPRQWKMLRGEDEFTLRDLGEIGHATGMDMHMNLSRNSHLEKSQEDPET